jgi:Mg-chelatase subunit ChlD
LPQSLITTPAQGAQALQINGRSLLDAHAQIASILRSRLGHDHAALLAQPQRLAAGDIAWSSPLEGSVQVASQLAPQDRERVQQLADQLSAGIRGLAQQLQAEGPAAQVVAQMLERALQLPPGDWLFSVGGKPVLAMWGHAAPGTVLPSLQPAIPPVPAAPAVAAPQPASAPGAGTAAVEQLAASMAPQPAADPPTSAPIASAPPRKPWRRRLAWAALALLLLALLLGLRYCSGWQEEVAVLAARAEEAEARNRALEDELRRRRAAQMMCVRDTPAPAPAPAPAASAAEPPQAPELPASAVPGPLDSLRKRVSDAGQQCGPLIELLKRDAQLKERAAAELRKQVLDTLQRSCKDTLVREAKNLCPGERPKQVVPEFVIVFDASPSMAFSLDAARAQIELAMRMGRPEMATRDPQRVKPAREAAIEVARRVPRDMSTGLVMVDSCRQGARPVGFFGPGQRAALLGKLAGIQPHPFNDEGGTPLADGIARAGQMVDGVGREATILVISDGEESCRGNPCAVAQALAAAKPKLKINVLDIDGTGAGNCLAAATKGQVFTARNAADVVSSMRRASQEVMGPAHCRP